MMKCSIHHQCSSAVHHHAIQLGYRTHECLYEKDIFWMNKYWPMLMSLKPMTFNSNSVFYGNDGSQLNVMMTTLNLIKCVKWWMRHLQIREPLQAGIWNRDINHLLCGYKVYVKHTNTMFWWYLYPCLIILRAAPAFVPRKFWHW